MNKADLDMKQLYLLVFSQKTPRDEDKSLISQNGAEPKYDIRDWDPELEKMRKV